MIDAIVGVAEQALREKAAVPSEERNYVNSVEDVPEGYEAQRGEQNGIFWVDDNAPSGGSDDSSGGGSESSDGIEAPEDKPSDSPEDDGNGPSDDVNASAALDEFRDSERAKEGVEALYDPDDGGFTFPNTLDPDYNLAEQDYWLVGITSENYNTEEVEVGVEEVADFYDKYGELFEEYPSLKLGGFNFPDKPKISVDLSVSVESKEEAERLGEELNQHSVFNPSLAFPSGFEEGSEETGGDGEPTVETPEEVREVMSDIETLTKHLRGLTMAKNNPEPVYESEDGDRYSASAIAHGVRHGALDAEAAEDGFSIDGTLYREVESDDDDDTSEKLADAAAERLEEKFGGDGEGN